LWTQGKAMALELAIDDAVQTHDAANATDRSTAPLSIRLLGGLEVRRGDILLPEQVWGRKRDRLLFAYLLIAGQAVSREALLDALWPNLAPAAAGASLRVAWSRLKRALEPGLKEGQPSAYLEAEAARFGLRWSSIATDVLEF
jgi:DNA-binding SARP family transcriptional activator